MKNILIVLLLVLGVAAVGFIMTQGRQPTVELPIPTVVPPNSSSSAPAAKPAARTSQRDSERGAKTTELSEAELALITQGVAVSPKEGVNGASQNPEAAIQATIQSKVQATIQTPEPAPVSKPRQPSSVAKNDPRVPAPARKVSKGGMASFPSGPSPQELAETYLTSLDQMVGGLEQVQIPDARNALLANVLRLHTSHAAASKQAESIAMMRQELAGILSPTQLATYDKEVAAQKATAP